MPRFVPPGLGWHRDLPDCRDYGAEHGDVAALLASLQGAAAGDRRGRGRRRRPSSVCWEEYFSPTECQQGLNASPAYAVAGLVGYYERRSHGGLFDGSPLFLYKMSRLLLQWGGDSGATLRDTIKALVRFGLPPRKFCPDVPERFDDEPDAFIFAYARDYQHLRYVRLDPPQQEPKETLAAVRSFLAAGLPVVFGVTVFDSIGEEAEIPFPSQADTAFGGQALVAVGYDDGLGTRSGRGALRVRASWGPDWGERGYGWLPYTHIKRGLAADFWTILRPDWIEKGDFPSLLS